MKVSAFPRWRQLATCCALVTLAACSNMQPRPAPANTTPVANPVRQIAEPQATVPAFAPLASGQAPTPWQRLRQRFLLPSCDYSNAVMVEARRYASHPERFSNTWRSALPLLLLVLDRVERHDLPGELALLPYVESHYRQLPANGNGAAGMWQLMGRTAVDHGLRVSPSHDERLDALAATDAVIELMERYDREFGDWRAADLAFNAGEFRVKNALAGRRASDLSAETLARIKLNATTHQHLARLIALACIIRDPQQFGVTLPDVDPATVLHEVALPTAIDLRLAAALSELPMAELFRFNAAWTGQSSQSGPASRLLLPIVNVDRFNRALAQLPATNLDAWHVEPVAALTTIEALATALNTTPTALAAANHLEAGTVIVPGMKLLVPGAERGPERNGIGQLHTIKRGDTLSAIAGRYGISLKNLLRWNAMTIKSILRPGAILRVTEAAF